MELKTSLILFQLYIVFSWVTELNLIGAVIIIVVLPFALKTFFVVLAVGPRVLRIVEVNRDAGWVKPKSIVTQWLWNIIRAKKTTINILNYTWNVLKNK